MRIAVLAVMVLALAGCGGGGTGPEAPAIVVSVTDDIGGPVDRMQVIVTRAPADRIDGRTRGDGTIRVAVRGAGDYEVRVIPGAFYLGVPGTTSRTVTVGSGGTASVDFTVHRVSLPPPPAPGDEQLPNPGDHWPEWPRGPAVP
jgi:hypothetical protein